MSFTVEEFNRSARTDQNGVRTYTRVFRVQSTDPTVGPLTAGNQVSYSLYEPYNLGAGNDQDFTAILKNVEITTGEERGFWHVTLTYDSSQNATDRGATTAGDPFNQPPGGTPGQTNNQAVPENRPWKVAWRKVNRTEFLTRDYSAPVKDVVTSAGQPFDPPIQVPASNLALDITLYRTTVDVDKILSLLNHVNEFEYLGFPAGHLLCDDYSPTAVFENGQFYWEIHVSLEFQRGGWNPLKVLDAGTLEITSQDLPLQPIKDRAGNPVSTPVPLDGFGTHLLASDSLVYLEFTAYPPADFAALI